MGLAAWLHQFFFAILLYQIYMFSWLTTFISLISQHPTTIQVFPPLVFPITSIQLLILIVASWAIRRRNLPKRFLDRYSSIYIPVSHLRNRCNWCSILLASLQLTKLSSFSLNVSSMVLQCYPYHFTDAHPCVYTPIPLEQIRCSKMFNSKP